MNRKFWLIGILSVLFVGLMLSGVMAQEYKEAPALAEMVKAGTLPPIEERLPENPLVVAGVDGIGQYGGTWRMGMMAGTDDVSLFRIVGYEPLVRWNTEWTDLVPGVAEKWEVNDEATEFTFYLRKGIKWSDGVPFTADDIMFWWEDVQLNEELTTTLSNFMTSTSESGEVIPAEVIKVDDYTITIKFPRPNGLFLSRAASPDSRSMLAVPKHFAQQYHAKYQDPAKLEEMMKAGGYTTWKDMFIANVTQSDGGGYGQYNVAGSIERKSAVQ